MTTTPLPLLQGGSRAIDRDPQRAVAEPSRIGELLFVFQSIGEVRATRKPKPCHPIRCPGVGGFDGT